MRSVRISLCALVALAFTLTSYAATPIQISHQGILRDASNTPVTGTRSLTFHIYDSELGGSPLWSEVHPLVPVEEGLFNVTLGSVTALTSEVLAPAGSGLTADPIQRYLEVQVDADPPLVPRTRLIAAPYAVATSRLAGDIETQPGSFTANSSNGNHLQGAVDVLQARLFTSHDEPESSDSVIVTTARKSGSVILTDRMGTEVLRSGFANDSTGASAFLSADSDDDGVLESSILHISRPTGANLAIKTKGTSAQRLGSNIGATRDSAGVRSGYDEDGDGINETEVTTVARKALGRMKCSDVTLERAYLSAVSADSSGSSLSLDSKLNPNAARDNFLQGAADILQARLMLGSDSDNDGVTDNSVEQRSTSDSASVSTVSRFGSGPRQTTSMDGSFAHSRVTCASDLDADGLADNETEDFADAATARMRVIVSKHTLEPHEARMSADVAGPRIEISSASTVRASMSLDGVQVSDNSGVVVSEIGSDGNAYIAGNMKFGAIAGAHRIDVEGGAYCDGTNWVNASDANSKENFATVDGREILSKLSRLDITRWNYKGQADAAHIGPTAQDFREVFGVGSDDKSISTIDPSGIALAAIKELNRQNQELRDRNNALKSELDDLKRKVDHLIENR